MYMPGRLRTDRGRAALAGQDVVGFLAGNRLHRIDVEEFAVVFVPALTLLIAHGQTAPVINLAHTSTPPPFSQGVPGRVSP